MSRPLAPILAALALAAGPAVADEVIATAPAAGAPPAAPAGPEPLQLPVHRRGGDVLRPLGPCGAPDRRPHGEVWAGVGTHGYREGGGVVCTPLGDHAAATIAVDAGRYGGRR